jgi:hypothetical protein
MSGSVILRPVAVLFTDPVVVTGLVAQEESATRSSTSYCEFGLPGMNERLLEEAGFKLVMIEDVTQNEVEVSHRWHAARQRRAAELIRQEGKETLPAFSSSWTESSASPASEEYPAFFIWVASRARSSSKRKRANGLLVAQGSPGNLVGEVRKRGFPTCQRRAAELLLAQSMSARSRSRYPREGPLAVRSARFSCPAYFLLQSPNRGYPPPRGPPLA